MIRAMEKETVVAKAPVDTPIRSGARAIPLTAGALLSLSFTTWLKMIPTVALTMAIFALPFLVTGVYLPEKFQEITKDPETGILMTLLVSIVPVCLNIVSNQIYVGAIAYGAVETMRGRHCAPMVSVKVAFRRLLPLVGSALLVGLAVLAGTLCLIVPGFILFTMLAVTAPVVICENKPAIEAMKRSAELTRGHRLTVFGSMILIGIVTGILGAVIGGIAGFLLRGNVGSMGFQSIVTLFSMFAGSVASVLYAVIYFALRQRKDGVEVDEIAKVFE